MDSKTTSQADAAAGRTEPADTASTVPELLERIAFLEEQISELRRASMVEKALASRRAVRKGRLRRLGNSLVAALIRTERLYRLVKMRPLLRPIEDTIRRLRAKP